jgi:tRNA-Thr(GGU) m(6)t(6)A37 methyltransferase TsaA
LGHFYTILPFSLAKSQNEWYNITKQTKGLEKMKIIAKIQNDFKEKFGIPRQSGIAEAALGKIEFLKEYSVPDAFRGITEYSHLWLIWDFSLANRESWSPTVRPPRLGGNRRMGVFATRSPFRPNSIGLSSVRLHSVERDSEGRVVLTVSGADLMDGTPIYDVKPYLAFTDCHADAKCGFADGVKDYRLEVSDDLGLTASLSPDERQALLQILAEDPRPSYIDEGERIYTFKYGAYEISFRVEGGKLYITEIKGC